MARGFDIDMRRVCGVLRGFDMFKKGKWIYADLECSADQYTDYIDTFEAKGDVTQLHISADTDYTVWINGVFAASNQYGDFEHYKIYDTVDVTPYLNSCKNEIRILLYYCGVNTQRYRKAAAGLIYEVVSGGEVVAFSSEKTLSRSNPAYVSGQKRFVTGQLGFSFTYDATKERDGGYRPSFTVDKRVDMYPRPIRKQIVKPRHPIREITQINENTYLIDLGREVVGLACLDVVSYGEQKIRVAWGESLDDGRVRATLGARNFYYEYVARDGRNEFCHYMLRLSGRYLEVEADKPIEINYIGILPEVYEVDEIPCRIDGELDRRIYDTCVNTLRLCMMEHYVDTPWREQCLYAFDSRNQMLCGYYAFEGKNRDYARANLQLMGEDRRDDGLLSICYPCGITLAIPSFSLYYVIAMKEYMDYTGDKTLAMEYAYKMESVLDEFLKKSDGDLIKTPMGKGMWNFYDWSAFLDDSRGDVPCDLVLNCLFVMALDAYESMCQNIGNAFKYKGKADLMRKAVNCEFKGENGVFTLHKGANEYTMLGNALAILCGAANEKDAANICEKIVGGELTPSSLSMNIFKYEALLAHDAQKYADHVLIEIREIYKKMLDAGATTVWETEEGSVAFENAGSLCHGWSAVPVYIFHRLGIAKREENILL